MERIILIGHGSPKEDANNVEVNRVNSSTMHPPRLRLTDCVKVAYLQFVEPDIGAAIDACEPKGRRKSSCTPSSSMGACT